MDLQDDGHPSKRIIRGNRVCPQPALCRKKQGRYWTWTFKPKGGGTLLNLLIEYAIPVRVLGKIGERLVLRQNEREADVALA
jgi:hypothetical protein